LSFEFGEERPIEEVIEVKEKNKSPLPPLSKGEEKGKSSLGKGDLKAGLAMNKNKD
jgi:hypothetical protein